MNDTYMIIISVLVLLSSTYLFRRAAGGLDPFKLNIVSFTYYVLMIMSAIGSVFIGLGIDNHRVTKYIAHSETRVITWAVIMIMMIVMPLVIIGLNKLFKYDPLSFEEYRNREVTRDNTERFAFVVCTSLSAISIAAVVYTMVNIGIENNPLLVALKGASRDELQKLRISVAANFKGNDYIKNLLAITLTQFTSILVFINYRTHRTAAWRRLFIIMFLASSLMCVYNLEKAPILRYILTLVLTAIFMGYRLKTWQKFGLAIGSIIAVMFMYLVFAGMRPGLLLSLGSGPINRLFITSSIGSFLHFDIFTYTMPKLHGQSLHRIISKGLLGFESVVRSGRVVMEYTNPDGVKKGIAGVFNALFIGEAYANFGYPGVAFSMVYISCLIFSVQYIFTQILKKKPATLALFAYLSFNLPYTLHGGFADYIINMVWFFVIGVAICYNFSVNIIKRGGESAA